ncbi:MAG: helix-turn-helix domain-containing protein [Nitrospinales bacterium]
MAERIWAGENKIKAWREFRGLTQKELAEKSGTAQPYIAQLEKGERNGTAKTLKKIAGALDIDVDSLIS